MTQDTAVETIELAIVACETCDQLFLLSPRRQTCPGCGGGAGLVFFEFEGQPDGLRLKGAPLLERIPSPTPAEASANGDVTAGPPVPAEAGAADELLAVDFRVLVFDRMIAVVDGVDGAGEILGAQLAELGADPEQIAAAVGRLEAVRDLVADLLGAGAEPPAEPAEASPLTPPDPAEPAPEPASVAGG